MANESNLVPFTTETAPRNGGAWPEWRRALKRIVGDGEELFQLQMRIARGEAFPVYEREPDGTVKLLPDGTPKKLAKPVWNTKYGGVMGYEEVWIVPSAQAMAQAGQALMDRAFGKAVAVVVDLTPGGDGDAQATEIPLPELTEEERRVVQGIAHRRMLAAAKLAAATEEPPVVEGEVVEHGDP